jgi:glycogen debranching enzyme
MQNIWSWDNCFNALGVSKVEPELAFNQFLIFVKHQHESGVYPDFINDKFRSYNCVKPPIHAWAYQLLMNESNYFKEVDRLKLIYKSIVKTTEFWLTSRVKEIGGLPYYTHGNDSGWDNASIFHEGLPVIAPDLTAYLIQQLDLLSDWAELLDLETESKKWKEIADSLTDKLIKELYDSNKMQFIAKSMMTGREIEQYDSLILQLPIVISYRLPKVIKENLIENLMSRFESEFGLTTESSKSLLYQVDGYWLGPIWAPETYIFFDALHRAGEIDMSKRIAEKYCLLGETGGMAENYNPETGSGNDDLSFTWTSSVFLKLREFVLKGRSHE